MVVASDIHGACSYPKAERLSQVDFPYPQLSYFGKFVEPKQNLQARVCTRLDDVQAVVVCRTDWYDYSAHGLSGHTI